MPGIIQRIFGSQSEPEEQPTDHILNSLTRYALRHPQDVQSIYEAINPTSPTHENAIAVLRQSLEGNQDLAVRIVEQINPTAIASSPTQEDWYWGRLATGGEEDYYWRRLSDNWYQKDVIPSTYLEIHNACYEAYNSNPLAFAIVEITTSFVLGKGVKVVGKTPRVQKVIDAFWQKQNMDERCYQICTELSLYGEIFVRFFVNQYDGTVAIRFIDPSIIDQVECDPEDIETQIRFHRRPIGPSPTQTMDAVANTLNPEVFGNKQGGGQGGGQGGMRVDSAALSGMNPSDPSMAGKWFDAGSEDDQVMHFSINKVSNAKRGKSDLATLLPWLRRYKDWLTDRVRINKYKGAFLWDVALKGADAKTVNAKKMDYSYPPEPGSVIIHNDAEQWTAVQPAINANDAKEDGRAIKMMVAIGVKLPEHFLSDGDNNTRATAAEMGLPTFLKFQRRQRVIKNVLQVIFEPVVTEAQQVGALKKKLDPASAFEIIFPQFDLGDNLEIGNGLNYIAGALAVAKAQGWISDETAAQYLFKKMGEEIDIHEELAKVKNQGQTPDDVPARDARADPKVEGSPDPNVDVKAKSTPKHVEYSAQSNP